MICSAQPKRCAIAQEALGRFTAAVDGLARWEQRQSDHCRGALKSKVKFDIRRVIGSLHLHDGRQGPSMAPPRPKETSPWGLQETFFQRACRSEFWRRFSELTLQQGRNRRAQWAGSASFFDRCQLMPCLRRGQL
jgi:hypothetical protein